MTELKKTKLITYNVHDRGRKHRGVDRKFDTRALAALINGPETQERVKHGDMLGYFGHWPRVKFGMATQEGGILDGKAVSLPTALRTIHLSADNEGNITHQAEFLDTHEGRLAASLYDSSTGGFSSAIDPVPRTSPTVPAMFYGFDYVLEPNYTTNRGHAVLLDGVDGEGEAREDMVALFDAVAAESSIALELFDSVQVQLARALETLEHVSAENDLLIGRLAAGGAPLLDDIMGEGAIKPAPTGTVVHDFDKYRSMPLAELAAAKTKRDTSAEAEVLRQLGMKD